MNPSYILLIISGVMLLLIVVGLIIYRLLYNRYINKRLKGETDKRKFASFNFTVFAIIMTVCAVVFCISFLSTSLIQARLERDYYRMRLEELYPRQQIMSDDAVIVEFDWLTDGMLNLELSGYIVTKTISGDYECFTARAKDAIINNSLFPSLAVYFKYIGDELVNPSIEFKYIYSDWQNESSITFNEQYLYISRLYNDEKLLSIDIKISIDPQGNKNPQFYSLSHFDFNK